MEKCHFEGSYWYIYVVFFIFKGKCRLSCFSAIGRPKTRLPFVQHSNSESVLEEFQYLMDQNLDISDHGCASISRKQYWDERSKQNFRMEVFLINHIYVLIMKTLTAS